MTMHDILLEAENREVAKRIEGNYPDHYDRISTRLAAVATRLECSVPKEEIRNIKVWTLSSVLGGMALAATLATVIVRFFSSP